MTEADADLQRYAGQVQAMLDWIDSRLVLASLDGVPPARPPGSDLGDTLAGQLAGLDPSTRRAVISPDWPPDATAALLAATPAASRADIAAELAALGDLPAILEAALRLGAPDAEALLDPGSPASLLLQAVYLMPDAAAYARQLATNAATLAELADALFATAAPSLVTRTTAILHDALSQRLGTAVADAYTRGALLQRLLRPALSDQTGAGLDRLLATEPPADERAIDEALYDYAAEIVAAGHQAAAIAEEGEDADDLLVQRGAALQNPVAFAGTFRAPTPADKLGTLPTLRVTALGQAILKARASRPSLDDADWSTVVALQEEAPAGFDELLLDERCAVLDAVIAGRVA